MFQQRAFVNICKKIKNSAHEKDIGKSCCETALRIAKLLKVYDPPKMDGSLVTMRYIFR